MSDYLVQIPENIHTHIREITKTSGLEESEESVDKIAESWLEKKKVFEDQIQTMEMVEVDLLDHNSIDGALALTYSGSLINIGPKKDEERTIEYTSIGLRSDVPQSAMNDASILSGDVKVDECLEFEVGPVQTTSPIYKIAVCMGDLDVDDQEELINNTTQLLKEEFVNVNKTIVLG